MFPIVKQQLRFVGTRREPAFGGFELLRGMVATYLAIEFHQQRIPAILDGAAQHRFGFVHFILLDQTIGSIRRIFGG